MNRIIKQAAIRLLPPLRRLVAQRDNLLAASVSDRSDWNKHRPNTAFSHVDPKIGTGSKADDKRIVERLLKAYQRSSSGQYGHDSMWGEIFEAHHKDCHKVFMRGDVEKARQILANPGTNDMFYGFDELCESFVEKMHANPQSLANACQDNLIRLAEAIGAFRLESTQGGPWNANLATPTDEVVKVIEEALGAMITFPDIYPGTIGAGSSRGIISYRAIQSLYLACRVSQIVHDAAQSPSHLHSICEIGAGLGRSALFANQLGLKDYTLVDVPMTTISQGYYLMRCLGEDAVVLPGEARSNREQIRLMHSDDFFSSDERFDLIVNVDSLTELGHDLAIQYLRKISAISPAFLSINHEVNSIRIIDLLKELKTHYSINRYPYWMRQGYAEEFVKFKP